MSFILLKNLEKIRFAIKKRGLKFNTRDFFRSINSE